MPWASAAIHVAERDAPRFLEREHDSGRDEARDHQVHSHRHRGPIGADRLAAMIGAIEPATIDVTW